MGRLKIDNRFLKIDKDNETEIAKIDSRFSMIDNHFIKRQISDSKFTTDSCHCGFNGFKMGNWLIQVNKE